MAAHDRFSRARDFFSQRQRRSAVASPAFASGSGKQEKGPMNLSKHLSFARKVGAPAWMKLITTLPLERYDIPTFGPRMSPRALEARQSHYD
jgi:hypothetical protein